MKLADGFDDCVIGVVERCGCDPYVIYSAEKMIDKMVERDGMDRDEAWEFFHFNIQGAWVGDDTPGYMHTTELYDLELDIPEPPVPGRIVILQEPDRWLKRWLKRWTKS